LREFSVPWNGQQKKVMVPEENIEAVVAMHDRPALADPQSKLREVLEDPVGCEKLADMLHPGDRVAIASSEYSRDPFTWLLGTVIEEVLVKAGIRDEDVCLVTAPGTHQNREQQLGSPATKQVFGSLAERYRLVIQDADEKENLSYSGVTSQNTPVFINKAWVDADVKIGFGEVSPNLLACFCGGAKIVCPGISGRTTIGANHRLIMKPDFRKWLMTESNYVRQDMNEIARMAGLDFKIDVVINSKREVVNVFGGDFIKEYSEAAHLAEKIYGTRLKRRTDIALWFKPDDFPRAQGKNLRSGLHYMILAADLATKEDGIVIGVFSGKEGFSRGTGEDLLKIHSEELMWRLATNMKDPHEFCDWEHRRIVDVKRTFVVSNLPPRQLKEYGIAYATDSPEEALAKAFEEKGKDATITVLVPPSNIASQYVYPIL